MKETENLEFLGSDPGAVKFGNFINYYSFHNVEKRTANLHAIMFPTSVDDELLCLDVGCNSGELTQEFYLYLKKLYPKCSIQILAIDIDPKLIERARISNKEYKITFLSGDIMTDEAQEHIKKHLESYNKPYFDITFCFSVTMWIHLNNGDDGLLAFIKYLKLVSKILLIEPQPWNCYRNAQRRVKKTGNGFDTYKSLKIRHDVDRVLENVLTEIHCTKISESPQSSWNRKIKSYLCKNQ